MACMSWTDYLPSFVRPSRAQEAPVVLARDGSSGPPDLSEFERSSWDMGGMSLTQVAQFAAFGMGVRQDMDPRLIPPEVLELLDYDTTFSIGNAAITAPALDPELYYLRGSDRDTAEVDAWLRPILPALLACFVRAFSYGSIPLVLDWTVETLSFEVPDAPSAPGEAALRRKNLAAHAHYDRVHELWPSDVSVDVKNDRLLAVIYGGKRYGGQDLDDPSEIRGYVATWDKAFGKLSGCGSRHRAFGPWWRKGQGELWNGRFLERGVDLPRVGYAPEGKVKVNGQEIDATKILRAAILSLRNGSALILPSSYTQGGEPLWKVDVLKTTEGAAAAFDKSLDRYDVQILEASFVPRGGVDKATEEQISDSAQRICDFAAERVSEVIAVVDRLRNGKRADAPRLLANDVPKRKRKLLLEIFGHVKDAVHETSDGKRYKMSELVHPEILPQLGVRTRTIEEAARAPRPGDEGPAPGQPGRPIEPSGDRDQRRDDSRTIDGESDTGGGDVERQERESMRAQLVADIQALRRENAEVRERLARAEGAASVPASLTIHNAPPEVNVSPAAVHYHAAEQPPTVVHVAAPSVTVEAPPAQLAEAPTVVVNVPEQPAPVVNIENVVNVPKPAAKDIRVSFDHGSDGAVSSATGTVTPTE